MSQKIPEIDKNRFNGKTLFLDRDNINTDEIIPAKYLTFVDKAPLKSHLLEDLKMQSFDPKTAQLDQYTVLITKENFGCGSSREGAVWAFEENGFTAIIAKNFARIFHENTFNRGVLAIELESSTIEEIFQEFSGSDTQVVIDIDKMEIKIQKSDKSKTYPFSLNKLEKDLILAGGWLNLANSKY